MRTLLLILVALLGSGCHLLPPTPSTPMVSLHGSRLGPDRAAGLILLLPGIGDRVETLLHHGLPELAGELAPDLDVAALDAHLGYYTEEVLDERLLLDVVVPAREAGYEQIWLMGFSLGGLGASSFAERHPELVDGVVLVAPFLGDLWLEDSVLAAETLASWDPAGIDTSHAFDRRSLRAWIWLRDQVAGDGRSAVFLGYGSRDGPGTLDERLYQALPPERTSVRPGGHEWAVWKELVRDLLPQVQAEARAQLALSVGPALPDDLARPERVPARSDATPSPLVQAP